MNKYTPYTNFAAIAETLLAQDWIFAKTMPENPHWYALRKNFKADADFIKAVRFIWDYGYSTRFKKRTYICLDINEYTYWCMSNNALPNQDYRYDKTATILINRTRRGAAPYDAIAPQYDRIFSDAESLKENEEVLRMIGYSGGSVLEIGCASCPIRERLNAEDYCGIDPSRVMIELAAEKSRSARLIQSYFEAFYDNRRYDYIIATFGTASYIYPEFMPKVYDLLEPQGRLFLMLEVTHKV